MAENPPARRGEELPAGYAQALADIKSWVAAAQTRAALKVNTELICLYWQIGQEILRREESEGWGAKVVDRLAADLKRDMPEMKGFSVRSLRYMREMARAWGPEATREEMLQQPAAKLLWGHQMVLLDRVKDPEHRAWYAAKAVEEGWSRSLLEAQIASSLRERLGGAVTSFERALPRADSELVRDVIKDPYNFEFLNLSERAKERDLELALLNDVQEFLMEMGRGFALVGRQYPLRVLDEETGEESEFFLDLVFYNYLLRRFVVIDLKIEDFKPEFSGKMNFYLNAVDELLRQPGDEQSIGLVLCPGRNKTVTEWALRGVDTPMAVSRYVTGVTLTEETPEELKPALPALPELATELSDMVEAADVVYDGKAVEEPGEQS
jgi:predicted nuclease of restriction endonuclease-like (RecB) superfamily